MAQQVLRSRVSIPSTHSGIDAMSLDFTWEATGANTTIDFTVSPNPTGVITGFFNITGTQSNPIGAYMAASLSRAASAMQINYTDVTAHLDGSNAGPPFRTDLATLTTASSASDSPGQVCACVAYRADYGTAIEKGPMEDLPTPDDAQDYGAPPTHPGRTRPRARYRSRFFLGPLCTGLPIATLGGGLNTTFKNDLGIAMTTLLQTWNSGTANQFNCVVWSKADAMVRSAKYYFVNENCASQRRRADPTETRVHAWTHVP